MTWTPTYSSFSSYVGSCTTGYYSFNATSSAITVDALNFYSSASGSLKLYDSTSNCTGSTYAVIYNSTSFSTTSASTVWAVGNTVDLTTISRYIAVPYSSTATTTPSISVKYTNSSSTCSASQVVITNSSGVVLTVGSACVGSTQTTLTSSETKTVGDSGSFYILYTRAGDTAGGIRVWQTATTY